MAYDSSLLTEEEVQEITSQFVNTPKQILRDNLGKYRPGTDGGPGNPYARKVAALKKAMIEAVSPEVMKDMIQVMVEKVLAGDLAAAKFIFPYLLGKPKEEIHPDHLDTHEWQIMRENTHPAEEMESIIMSPDQAFPHQMARMTRFMKAKDYLSMIMDMMDKSDERKRLLKEKKEKDAQKRAERKAKKEQEKEQGKEQVKEQEQVKANEQAEEQAERPAHIVLELEDGEDLSDTDYAREMRAWEASLSDEEWACYQELLIEEEAKMEEEYGRPIASKQGLQSSNGNGNGHSNGNGSGNGHAKPTIDLTPVQEKAPLELTPDQEEVFARYGLEDMPINWANLANLLHHLKNIVPPANWPEPLPNGNSDDEVSHLAQDGPECPSEPPLPNGEKDLLGFIIDILKYPFRRKPAR